MVSRRDDPVDKKPQQFAHVPENRLGAGLPEKGFLRGTCVTAAREFQDPHSRGQSGMNTGGAVLHDHARLEFGAHVLGSI
jgi:hypothetical protein